MKPKELKDWRKKMRLTREALAKTSGLAFRTIVRYETGECAIPSGVKKVLSEIEAKILETQTRWIILTKGAEEKLNDWASGPWVVSITKEAAESLLAFYPDRKVVEVAVRRLIKKFPRREEWDELRRA